MRKIREALRLSFEGLTGRQIGTSLGVSRSTIQNYLLRAQTEGLTWPRAKSMRDSDVERVLFASRGRKSAGLPVPNWASVHRELRGPGVTLQLLWQEYRAVHPEGYGYSQYCALHREWRKKLHPTMRQHHPAGERLFVDYAGQIVDIVDPETGAVHQAQLFVATLGASNYTYAEATWTQNLSDWVSSHVRAFEFFGGVASQVVPDNLKSGVTKACIYDPQINRTYAEMAEHYGVCVIPTRPGRPKDKSKVEVHVQVTERHILAALRKRTFFSLQEANQAISERLDLLNAKQSRHLGASRSELFKQIDKPALRPLPGHPYVYAEWKKCRAGLDYHVAIKTHYYSVPHTLIRKVLWARITDRTVEFFHDNLRVASHVRTSGNRQHSTQRDHMPSHHQYRDDWTPERICAKAGRVGDNVAAFAEVLMRKRRHPEQSYRTCMGVIRLADKFGSDRVDAACKHALQINAYSYRSVHSILKTGIDKRPRSQCQEEPAITHPNIRGSQYFH